MFIVCLSFSSLPFFLSLHYYILSVFISGLCFCPSFSVPSLSLSIHFSLSLSDRTAAHKDICFQDVDEDLICTMPRPRLAVTYSECCCHYGHGWGPECRTCPQRNSGELTAILLKSNRGCSFPLRSSGKLTAILPQIYKRAHFLSEVG